MSFGKKSMKVQPVLPIRKGNGFFPWVHRLIRSEQFKRLKSSEKVVLMYICSGYNGQNGTEADPIICPYNQVPVKSDTMAKALRSLSETGWIRYVTYGGLMKNPNRYSFGPTLRGFYK